MHLFLLPISTDDLSDTAFHECVLMNIVVPAITREVNNSSAMSPKQSRMKFQDDRVLLFMDGQREQVRAVTEHAEELHARKIDVFRGIPATTARTQPLDNSQCFPILRNVLREGVAKLNKQASKRQQPPGGKKKRSKNEFFLDMRPEDNPMEWTREEFAVRDQAVQFLEANGNPLDADERKLLCHFIVELRRILACMLSPNVVAAGWRNAGLYPFNIRTILNHSTKFRQLLEAEQQRIEDKVKELMGVARYDGDLSPEEFWEVMPEEDKEALSVLAKPAIERPFVNLTCKAEMQRRKDAAAAKAAEEEAAALEKEEKQRAKEAKRREKEEKKAATEARKAERAEQKRRAEEAGEGSQAKRRRTKCQGCKDDFDEPMRWSFWSQCHRCKLWWCGTCTGCRCRQCRCAGEDCACKCTCGGSKGRTCWNQHKLVCSKSNQ